MKGYHDDWSNEPTPPLAEFRAVYDLDDNIWWVIGCGHHQNLFDAACERIDELVEQNEVVTDTNNALVEQLRALSRS